MSALPLFPSNGHATFLQCERALRESRTFLAAHELPGKPWTDGRPKVPTEFQLAKAARRSRNDEEGSESIRRADPRLPADRLSG